jgi:hypothetical protein
VQLAGRLVFVLPLLAYAPVPGAAFERVAENVGERSEGQILESFERVFATPLSPARSAAPEKCATSLLREYELVRHGMAAETVEQIEAWLSPAASTAMSAFETDHFRFAYTIEGVDAVPAEDSSPADGVPDWVARCGAWAEASWSVLVNAGFGTPLLRDGRVDVTFREMSAFGYTRLENGVPALVLHRDYAGFPANDDPDGPAVGAAKVTIAHELKHALQYAASGWSEGGWLEADAVWAEDLVFDATDDYLRYLSDGSPISDPAAWLPVSYEDCLFPRLLAERHGNRVLVDFFARRASARAEPVLASFDAALRGCGSSLRAELAQLGLWTWFCGANATGRPVGFEEAARYPTPPIAAHVETARQGRLGALGTHHVLATAAGREGSPLVAFAADAGAPFVVWTVLLDREGNRSYQSLPVHGTSAVEIGRAWEDIATLALIVTHVGPGDADADYGLSVATHAAVGVDASSLATAFAVQANRPNPFRESTSIRFSLPSATNVRVSIFDLAGRLVRVLEDGASRPAGDQSVTWDGRDSAGRRVAPGLYASRVEAYGLAATRKMILVR